VSSTPTTAGRCTVDWVVFDLGETLVDETSNWGRWADGLGVTRLTFFAVLGAVIASGRPPTDAFDYFRPGWSAMDEAAQRSAAGVPWHLDETDLYADALPVLATLRQQGYRLAVMANQPAAAAALIAALPVDLWATSAGWELEKPDPRFFERVARELAAPADRIAYVGDRVDNDVLPARAAGMVAVHIRRGPWGHLHAAWPEVSQAHIRIEALTELPDALRSLGLPVRG
jgi:FMN phosphatase YigB (HAD superfamily)